MYLDYSTVKTSSGKKHTRILLRESYRENGKVKKRSLANMTNLPKNILATIKTMLNKGDEGATLANLEIDLINA
ncbi:MAG: hypothetical protein L3V56_14565 [Candidatus Magnetoovum sp. WYHC-5]|nr:hypothetical protein [Candidatus Magnetoovum sp. WYHC-5]